MKLSEPMRETIKDLFTMFIPLVAVGVLIGILIQPIVANYFTFLK